MIDVGVASILSVAFGAFVWIVVETVLTFVGRASGFFGTAGLISRLVATCTFITYFLFRDTIKYRFDRSIGKIMFQLRPIIIAPEKGAVTVKASVQRNGVLALALALLFLLISELELFFAFILLTLLSLFLFLEFVLTLFGEGRTLQDRLAKTKVIHIRSEEAMAIDPGRHLNVVSRE